MLRLNPSSLQIAHVLFMDLVSYSQMPTDVQSRMVEELQSLVRATPEFQKALNAKRLISLPTGDGMALVFLTIHDLRCNAGWNLRRS